MVLDETIDNPNFQIFVTALSIANQWHLKNGGMCLHSAGVVRREAGFIFLGDSGAGKTTISQLSNEIGYAALGDDLNFIVKNEDKSYHILASPSPNISPVGYSHLCPPLKGIFSIIKDEYDALYSLPPIQVSRILFKQFINDTPQVRQFPKNLLTSGFQICCDIAREIPGYELHFRKNPNFWKLIDEKFSG